MIEPTTQKIGDRYQLLDVIGKGGMGIVYRALDVRMNRPVAIKMLHGADAEDKETVLARFHREVTSLARLQHKNIVTIYTFEQHEGLPYMVMEYLEGQSIAEIISSGQPMSLTDKLHLVLQVCDGLQYAHDHNLVHRDIKPANILVLKNGTAKLIDFGIARAGLSENITRTGQIIGSLSYMSPEQLSNYPLDARTDVFSAGVVLFQFLTGELPFRGTEPSATYLKILNDPIPSLATFIKDYPPELDEILQRATAKKVDERYQSAEEFAFDLAQVLETLKRGMATELLERAKLAFDKRDWEIARQHLQDIRKLDRQNTVANEMFQLVSREVQRQQKSAQVVQLRSQAQLALANVRYEEALEFIEQGLRLDAEDTESIALREEIQRQAQRAQDLNDALRRGQAALYAGDLAEAQSAVSLALKLESNHTEAQALEHLIIRESAERAKKIQLQGFIESARGEIGHRNFLEALKSLQKAQAIDPSDSNIHELLAWAHRGHEQEKLRKDLEKSSREIGELLRQDRYEEALEACHAALGRFPDDPSLLKLLELSKRQCDIIRRRRAIDDTSVEVRRLVDSGDHERALVLLEQALQSFPGDPNLETLLAIARSELERKRTDEAERERHRTATLDEQKAADSTVREQEEVFQLLQSFRNGLADKLPVSQLRSIAEGLAIIAAQHRMDTRAAAQYSVLLADFKTREAKWSQDKTELDTLCGSIHEAMASAEIPPLLDRARFLSEQYGKDEYFKEKYQEVLQLLEKSKLRREAVAAQVSDLVRSMQESQDLPTLLLLEKQVQEVSEMWLQDVFIRSLVDRASAQVEEVREHKKQVLQELAQIKAALSTARSAGQMKLLEDQASMLSSEFTGDADIAGSIRELHLIANEKLSWLDRVCSELKELASNVATARTLAEAEKYYDSAEKLVLNGSNFEETDDLLRKVQRPVEERRKDYQRIYRNLELLVASSAKANGPAELDLILARRRDLVKKYPEDTYFQELEKNLEISVTGRRTYLAEVTASEQEQEALSSDNEEMPGIDGINIDPGTGEVRVALPVDKRDKETTQILLKPRRNILRFGIPAAAVAGVIGAGVFFILPKTKTVNIQIDPAGATITIDGRPCETPCTPKLTTGKHELVATQSGFEDLRQTLTVPSGQGNLPILKMKQVVPAQSGQIPPVAVPDVGATPGTGTRIVVSASVPGATVFVDGVRVGNTGQDGKLQIPTSAGTHHLDIEKPGFEKVSAQTIQAPKNGEAVVTFNLRQDSQSQTAKTDLGHNPGSTPVTGAPQPSPVTASPAPAPPADTYIVLNAPAGAEIHIDQQLAGHSTGGPFKSKVQPGTRTIEVFLSGYQPWKQTLSVDAGKQADLTASLAPVPVAVAAPSPSVSRSASSVSDEDRKQIQQILDRYANAITHKDLKQLHAVWPDVPKEQLEIVKGLSRDHKGVNISLTITKVSLLEGSEDAVVKCKQVSQYDGQTSEDNVTFYMGKLNTGWIINQIPRSN